MSSAGDAPTDTITALLDAGGKALTKGFNWRFGKLIKSTYPNSSEYRVVQGAVDGIDSLAESLDAIVADGRAAVIRGEPGKFFPRDGGPCFRLHQPQAGLVAVRTGARISQYAIRKYNLEPDDDNRWAVTWLPTFEEQPRRYAVLDVDREPVPEHMADDWVDRPEEAVEHLLSRLPEPLQTATCWWSLSSSAAIPSKTGREVSSVFKMRLAFWLDRPLTSGQLKRWMAAEKAPVDPAVFNAIQLVYLARPSFGHGLHDPVPRRSGLWRGEEDTVAVPEILPEPEAYEYTTSAEAFAPAEGLEDLCSQLRERLQGELHVREHLMQAARAYFQAHGANVEQKPLVEALEAVAREHRPHGEVVGYGVDRLVEHVARQERNSAGVTFGKGPRPSRMAPHFGNEGAHMLAELRAQKRFLRSWISRQHVYALARREIAERRTAAFAEAGLA